MSTIFISYRRQDSGPSANRIAAECAKRYGGANVFIDTDSIRAGENWSARINKALSESGIVIAVIGPKWLHTHDEQGRRRIDNEADWVRNELIQGLNGEKKLLPVLVQEAQLMPESALPEPLQQLCAIQNYTVSDNFWRRDMIELMDIVDGMGATVLMQQSDLIYPPPLNKSAPLGDAELFEFIRTAPAWSILESNREVHGRMNNVRELSRTFVFQSFDDCVHFMAAASRQIRIMDHHPRWENVWINLRVHLSTWDSGGIPTYKDTRLAKYLDELFIGYGKTTS